MVLFFDNINACIYIYILQHQREMCMVVFFQSCSLLSGEGILAMAERGKVALLNSTR